MVREDGLPHPSRARNNDNCPKMGWRVEKISLNFTTWGIGGIMEMFVSKFGTEHLHMRKCTEPDLRGWG